MALNRHGKDDLVKKIVEVRANRLANGEEVKKLTQVDTKELLADFETAVKELVSEVGDVLDLKSFLRLERYVRPSRSGVNPQTGEPITIAESEKVKAKAKF